MNRSYLISLLIFSFAIVSLAQSTTNWEKFSTPDKACSVLMPLTPQMQSQDKDVNGQKIHSDIWISKTDFGLYLLGTTDYPIDLDTKTELNASRDNFLKAVNAKLVDESDITVNGVPGREFTGVSTTQTYRSRLFYKNKRSTQIVAVEPTDAIDGARIKSFLESFAFGI